MNSEEMRMSRLSFGIAAIILVAVFPANMVFATSGNRTTSEQWTFTSSPGQLGEDGFYGPFSPDDGWSNDNGTPQLYVGSRATWGNNAWALRNDEMDIYIPNYPDNSQGTSKTMTVELTWKEAGLSILPDVPVIATSPTLSQITQANSTTDGWKTTTYTITLYPNPTEEWVFIKGDIYVDSVSVDTQCIPEPATLGLLIGGTFMTLKRSRGKHTERN